MPSDNTLVLATANKDKLSEIRMILKDSGLNIISMEEAGVTDQAEETGTTFAENALIKAEAVMQQTGKAAMADDSGLVIDHLDGAPGVYSSRFLGEDTPHSEKNKEIIRLLKDVEGEERSARFVCSVACIFPDGEVLSCEGTMEGRIAQESAGENGFGYDPIFFLPEYGCTNAQLTPSQKNEISHRGKAFRKMAQLLKERQR